MMEGLEDDGGVGPVAGLSVFPVTILIGVIGSETVVSFPVVTTKIVLLLAACVTALLVGVTELVVSFFSAVTDELPFTLFVSGFCSVVGAPSVECVATVDVFTALVISVVSANIHINEYLISDIRPEIVFAVLKPNVQCYI